MELAWDPECLNCEFTKITNDNQSNKDLFHLAGINSNWCHNRAFLMLCRSSGKQVYACVCVSKKVKNDYSHLNKRTMGKIYCKRDLEPWQTLCPQICRLKTLVADLPILDSPPFPLFDYPLFLQHSFYGISLESFLYTFLLAALFYVSHLLSTLCPPPFRTAL